jgi:hypothetical protein
MVVDRIGDRAREQVSSPTCAATDLAGAARFGHSENRPRPEIARFPADHGP